MSFRPLVIALTSLSFVALAPAPARAQILGTGATITVNNEASLPRLDKNGNTISKRPLTLTPEGVNYQDCIDDQQIDFPIVLTGFEANASFEAWAGISGADCGQQTNRTSATSVCWQLVTGIPLQSTVEVKIPVRKILAGAPPFTTQNLGQGADICGKVDLVTVSVEFLYFSPGQAGASPSASHSVSVTADTLGPPAPTGLSVLPGNTRIKVSWDNISGEGGVSALTGVSVYCDPSTGTAAAATDAGTTLVCSDAGDDAGDADADSGLDAGCTEVPNPSTPSDGGAVTTGGCSTPNFKKSDGTTVIPDAAFNGKYQCGSITGNTGTSVIADNVQGHPLVNGTSYAVAVAGTDAYGNVGPLSEPICMTPEVTTDFWDAYKDAGGGAGGGFCATSGAGMPGGSLAVIGAAAAIAFSLASRRIKRR